MVHAETINPIFYRFRGLKDRFPEIIFRIDPDLMILIFDPADLQDLLKSGLPRFVLITLEAISFSIGELKEMEKDGWKPTEKI